MKKIILLIVALSGLLLANTEENKAVCEGALSVPCVYKAWMDSMAIRDGKRTACEEHTKEELVEFGQSAQGGFLLGLCQGLTQDKQKPENGDAMYQCAIDYAISKHNYDYEALKQIIQESPCGWPRKRISK